MKNLITSLFTILFMTISVTAQEKVLKILAIGNSFSEDGIENYLYDLAKADGRKIIIGNMYIGGASVELHVKNSREDKAAYSYRKIGLDGEKVTTKEIRISQAIADEDWDYISLQQSSPYSGQHEAIMKDLPELITYVKSLKKSHTKLVYHQTWAYQQDSKHKGFANYDNNQSKMYTAIADATKKISKMKDFAMVIPAGTAIQNARTSSQGDTYTRDGYHLELTYGRFTAACTWYEKLFKKDVRKNSYTPEKVTEKQAVISKQAAHKSVKKPFKISKVNL
ncbi:DUF4886 domain-containing protein [Sphingobacterium bovistauri]|uniref:DUF4886 domain-containing protein n=1 Tax=Sphingobacterium bovistauri TaxID=2781959 RepID=A0ABS7Z4A0_9SPHI|nr:DUF4886 domain-containing protein [Sphingobacterium bovistauri]MCA5004985.1 DUF4886 domain-containing protein [Sphingobacterium bovistauri]